MKSLIRALTLLSFLFSAVPLLAQTATTTTTVTTAMTAQQNFVILGSATGVAAGSVLFIDNERVTVASINSLTARIARTGGGQAVPHGAGAIVYVATAAQAPFVFRGAAPSGACTAANEVMLPQVVIGTGDVWDCPAAVGLWINLKKVIEVACRALLVADQIDQSCFIVDRPYVVTKITEIHTTAESGGTLTIRPTRQQTTEAPASGDLLLSAQFNGVGTAQTLQTGALTATKADLLLTAGERLGLDFTDDVAGELAGVVVTFQLSPR